MNNTFLIILGKSFSYVSKLLNRGNGSTWPGHLALKGNKHFIKDILSHSQTKIIIVAGTNGKTTTAGLIRTGLEKKGKTVLQNESGANLLNGIASTILLNTNEQGKLTQDYAIFEVDENALPLVLNQVTPDYLVLLNLFRDQLDRYGEINTTAKKWQTAIAELDAKTTLMLNADDPQIAAIPVFLRVPERKTLYFGLQDKQVTHEDGHQAADSVSCPRCDNPLLFTDIIFSHLGNWHCKKCGLKRPHASLQTFPYYPLAGTYNKYNIHAAATVLKDIGMTEKEILAAFKDFKPAFGRQEVITYRGKHVQLFLSKNPTSFNQSFATIKALGAKTILFILNDRIPDGRDISWIWDTDLSGIEKFKHIVVSGDRTFDMALRIKYEHPSHFLPKSDLKKAIDYALDQTPENQTLYILPTYSAMLETRKILTGKKIL